MTLAAVSTYLTLSITLLTVVLVVVSLLIILVVMMQRPKQEGLGAAFGGGMTDQLLGAGTTSFLQKATVVLGILFFVLSLILGILVGRSNKAKLLDLKTPVPTEQSAAPAPGIADGIDINGDTSLEDEEAIMKAIQEAGLGQDPAAEEAPAVEAPAPEEVTPAEPTAEESAPAEDAPAEEESAPAEVAEEEAPETDEEAPAAE